jgi:hypothetical protein
MQTCSSSSCRRRRVWSFQMHRLHARLMLCGACRGAWRQLLTRYDHAWNVSVALAAPDSKPSSWALHECVMGKRKQPKGCTAEGDICKGSTVQHTVSHLCYTKPLMQQLMV